jgi:hypothetical protein
MTPWKDAPARALPESAGVWNPAQPVRRRAAERVANWAAVRRLMALFLEIAVLEGLRLRTK